MRTIFDGRMDVAYMQAYVQQAGGDIVDHATAYDGQVNGLLGAGDRKGLMLTTGLHTGDVGFRLRVTSTAPEVGAEWEDVVEAAFLPGGRCVVVQWGGKVLCEFDLPLVPHRVRYSARGMDTAHQTSVVREGEPLVDHYELVFWPADPTPDAIVRQGSEQAAYWHEARDPDRAAAQRIRLTWGDNPPSERLVDVLSARWLVEHDRGLAEALGSASPQVQRAFAHWTAVRACEEAGLDQLDWVAAALAALQRGSALPPPFDVPAARILRLDSDARVVRTTVTLGGHDGIDVQGQALFALVMAASDDPLDAALDGLTEATSVFGDEWPDLLLNEAVGVLSGLMGSRRSQA